MDSLLVTPESDGRTPQHLTNNAREGKSAAMSTLAEIEIAVNLLPPPEKQELLLHIAEQLRSEGALPEPRDIPLETMQQWIAQDERDGIRLREQFGI